MCVRTKVSCNVRFYLVVQSKLLTWVDPMLAKHLEDLGVSPPMFMLRWLRLAFVREFSVVRLGTVLVAFSLGSKPIALPTGLCLGLVGCRISTKSTRV